MRPGGPSRGGRQPHRVAEEKRRAKRILEGANRPRTSTGATRGGQGGIRVIHAGQSVSRRDCRAHPETAWVILAAGMGTRMKSERPKVLHPLCGRPLGSYALLAAREWAPAQVVLVTGHQAEEVERELGSWSDRYGVDVVFVRQQPQLGTGHAVMQAMPVLSPQIDEVVVSYADVPLLSSETLAGLCAVRRSAGAALAIATAVLEDSRSYGRVLRSGEGDRVLGVIEQRDATPDQLAIREINAGVYSFDRRALARALSQLSPDNAQHEYYLTDTVAYLATPRGGPGPGQGVVAKVVADTAEILGINDRWQLHELEREVRERSRRRLAASGVSFAGSPPAEVDPWVVAGDDTVLEAGAALLGETRIGAGCRIGRDAVLIDCEVEDEVAIEGVTLVGCRVERGARVGGGCPIAPGAVIRAGSRVGWSAAAAAGPSERRTEG